MSRYNLDKSALLKILLHSLKYPTTGVSGFLLGEVKAAQQVAQASPPSSPRASTGKVLHIYDAVPVCHNFLTLTLPLELALAQLEIHCKTQGKLRVVGYYQCNERMEDVELGGPGRRIADKIEAVAPGSVAIVLDGKAFKAMAEGSSQTPPVRLLHKDGSRGWIHAPTTGPEASFQCPSAGVGDLLGEYVAEGRHRRLVDYEDHLDDLTLDWFNPDLLA